MKRKFFALFFVGLISCAGAVLAFHVKFINWVYVPAASGPQDVCTIPLFGYTFLDNGQVPITRTASSIPVTVHCTVISIYPVTGNGS